MNGYRKIFYSRYQTAFKRQAASPFDYRFTDGKLISLIDDWCRPLDRNQPCLDLGCGSGALLHALNSMGFVELYGVDASAEQVKLAQEIVPRVQQGEIVDYLNGFPDNFFVLIALFDVIEHLNKAEIMEVVGLIHKKLAPKGVWLCHLPNGDSPGIGTIQFGDFTHETMLNPMSARNISDVFGFVSFEAREHLGASPGFAGVGRQLAWKCLRLLFASWNLIETGNVGSRIWTRVFAFKAMKKAVV